MIVGLINEWARRIFVRRPADSRTDEQVMSVWISPSRPRWDYVSETGPYRLIRLDRFESPVYWLETYDKIADAILEFDRFNQPRPNQMCLLVDGRDQTILGWNDQDDDDADFRYAIFGCKFGFDLLAVINPIDSALWESIAQREERP